MVFTDSCPRRLEISNGENPSSISILACECRRKSKCLDFLRHSHVSLLIDMGFTALAISDRVGHESEKITYRYAHLFPSKQAELAERLNFERTGGEIEEEMENGGK